MTMNPIEHTIEYLDPVSPNTDRKLFVPSVSELTGKRIAFVNNGWLSFTRIGQRMAQVLTQRFGIASFTTYAIPTSCAPPSGLLEQIAGEADVAIVGMAN